MTTTTIVLVHVVLVLVVGLVHVVVLVVVVVLVHVIRLVLAVSRQASRRCFDHVLLFGLFVLLLCFACCLSPREKREKRGKQERVCGDSKGKMFASSMKRARETETRIDTQKKM